VEKGGAGPGVVLDIHRAPLQPAAGANVSASPSQEGGGLHPGVLPREHGSGVIVQQLQHVVAYDAVSFNKVRGGGAAATVCWLLGCWFQELGMS
jgi:hypothetical protein